MIRYKMLKIIYLQIENRLLKAENQYFRDVLEGNITEIKKDITDLRVHQGHNEEAIEGK